MEFFKSNKTYAFMQNRLPFLGLSSVLIVVSIILLFTKGLNFGIDFTGGTVIQVQYTKDAPVNDIRNILNKTEKYSNSSVTFFGSADEVIIRFTSTEGSLSTDIGDEVREILKPTGDYKIRRVDIVGPKVGGELKEKGLMALSLSILIILIYVSYRFEWRFAVASVFALVHDVTITLGALIVFNIDINLDILAAILTILGYSINDTIIVFDRIREGVKTSQEKDLAKVINQSVSKTLSRTTLTSLTTFFVVLTLFVFGGEIINGFSFTLLIGIIVGTYSSIFVAASLLVQLNFSIINYRENEAKNLKRQKEKERLRAQFEQGTL
jgi:preprotein translocase subunit SecF